MLKRSRLLFMDEATASVDSQTDAVIQKIIREDFAACTIISIAHRIPTVMDCDRVLVIDAGADFSPFTLYLILNLVNDYLSVCDGFQPIIVSTFMKKLPNVSQVVVNA